MIDRAFSVNQALSRRLLNHIGVFSGGGFLGAIGDGSEIESPALDRVDAETPTQAIVTANEINDKHGTGPLVKRLFRDRPNLFCIRSKSDWGEHDFGRWNAEVRQTSDNRPDWFRNVLWALGGRKIESVFCVPYLASELQTSIAIQSSFGATLFTYLMDDQNILDHVIPDDLMREFLERCSLRLATHPELRHLYQRKFGLDFHLLPAIVPASLVITEPTMPREEYLRTKRGAMLGSFWDQGWFDATCEALAGCDSEIDWYGNNKSPWLTFSEDAMKRAGINALGVAPEPALAERLRQYPFVIVPYARLDGRDSNPGVACLSLPGRILFALAASQTPVLILGSERSCPARLLRHLDTGDVAPYTADGVSDAINRLTHPDRQRQLRQNAASVAGHLSDRGVVEWLRASAEQGRPADDRFEQIFQGYDPSPVMDVIESMGFRDLT